MNKQSLILVVDDNLQNLKVLGNTLIENGLNPAIAKSGASALAFVKKKLPELILLDVMMPEIDGFEVCKRLKQDIATKDIPIIFLTAKTEIEDIIDGFELGAVDYVTKPFNTKELMTRINTHLELKAARDTIFLQKEELKHANATKDKFFSIISHDLGNLFNTLIGFSSLLTTQNKNLSTAQKEDFLQRMLNASNKGYNLLKNLLEWSRVQTGHIVSKPTALNLQEIVADNIDLSRNHAYSKGIELSSSISETTIVFADRNMLDTVIRNLLSNAIKFTPAGGRVEITSQGKNTEEEIVVSISDTGVGIIPQDIEKLFRIDVSHTTIGTGEEKGTGLGLILCKEFVEKNGGTIWVESEVGKGSQFYIRLPVQQV
ncbi:hybrid sensor histidine kinase/response regulator [Candidatus Parabeggiatoa sp. HSG14]|uniref:hybrid sensor histidine kinase/response regulator n=1 Tax=Candidatus Parabeggiatoa sp. HSG14 TaxID=3055593 RepID=UPI0025A87405|nr:hybrid sensor histidine kinase/response regulator [Thiotrichales bacterium HSG14]